MEIYKYKNYEEYKKKQIEANVRKLDRTWVDPASLKNVMKYIHDNLNVKPRKILESDDTSSYFADEIKKCIICSNKFCFDCVMEIDRNSKTFTCQPCNGIVNIKL